VALLLFFLIFPLFTFPFTPISSLSSRKHEFEADEFAVKNANGAALAAALVKLYGDNASTLTPDPVYAAFYSSHPEASVRIETIEKKMATVK
jgi:STE24 endopeptidase